MQTALLTIAALALPIASTRIMMAGVLRLMPKKKIK
jgi:hypothetical protein